MALRLSTGLRNALLSVASFQDAMAGGVIDIYSGTQPTTADDVESGTKLLSVTVGSGAFSPGTATNGLTFAEAVNGSMPKTTSEVWSGVAVASGTAGWFRFYANDKTTGASTTGKRFDGAISTSGAQLNMSSTAITSGATTTIDSFSMTMPAS